MEAGTATIRRAWIPVEGVAQFSEPKTKRGRRTIALDPVTLEALKAHAARQADEQVTGRKLRLSRPGFHARERRAAASLEGEQGLSRPP